jgi:hypothetical protein
MLIALVVYAQLYLRKVDLGFNKNEVMMVTINR